MLIAILDRVGADGDAWPSLTRIAADAGISRPTAVRAVKRLVELGYLIRLSGSRTESNRYRAGRCATEPTGRCTDAPTGRCSDEPGVGANPCVKVGAEMNLESTYKNLPNESTQKASAAGLACIACRKAGLIRTNPSHPDLLAAIAEGATIEQFEHTAREAVEAGKHFGWVIATVRGRNRDATKVRPITSARTSSAQLPRDTRSQAEIDQANDAEQARFGLGGTP